MIRILICTFLILIMISPSNNLFSQEKAIPLYDKQKITVSDDWLVKKVNSAAAIYKDKYGNLVLSNGLVSRTFTLHPNTATVELENLRTGESFIRAIKPEAEVQINGNKFIVGGLSGQKIMNYILPEWYPSLTADPASFQMISYEVNPVGERFPWKKRKEWISDDVSWPAQGLHLVFIYKASDELISNLYRTKKGSEKYDYLKNVMIKVHYELYDGLPVFCKWITVENKSDEQIMINTFRSEILACTEPESAVDNKTYWKLPNISIETDYRFGGMSDDNVMETSVSWGIDPAYTTQVNYELKTPCLLEVYPKIGPAQEVKPTGNFESFRTWEMLNDNFDRERKGLATRKLYRALAPWVLENPILMHVRNADNVSVKKAIDQCAEVGFEMVIMTFGSGFDLENTDNTNIARMKALGDYAHAKGIALGGYSLLASRKISKDDDVVMPTGKSPRFGNSPCLQSKWGIEYFDKLYNFYKSTGLDVLEHDGSYPGDVCASVNHPGHKGLEDSQWKQYNKIKDFYQWCRANGIYLNVPDCYYMAGSNKSAMGYRETNWSLPREQQEIIERQNVYDGTWDKTPSMGWMFVPLVEYQGGGAAATIEPLKEHLAHYGQRLANLFGAGVQACYRGPQLYDAPETKEIVEKWVSFYKKHRQVLDADIVHVRRPDSRDYDAILHVNPFGIEKGLLMVYNPLNEPIKRTLRLSVYYTGLTEKVLVSRNEGKTELMSISNDNILTLPVEIPARSQCWFVMTSAGK
jgi:hypothetical protein